MGKKNIIIITSCIVFIVISGIIYLQPGGSKSTSFTGDISEDILQDEGTIINKNGQETEEENNKTDTTEEIAVYICGAVKHPGVYSLLSGQRICDAVQAAGGFKKSADRSAINLAKVLADGEQVVVLSKKQAASNNKNNNSQPQKDGGLVNINTASKEELMSLPGIGESKADAVMDYRLSCSFKSIEDIKNVTGIKDGVFNQIKDQITV
ncbi:MAG: ComEA family DNA-binding protein [Lachnospiraceae bacterium]|nr:ComEA family DNA-binding protein [Lachnospiraceae bacterium]